MKRKVQGSLWAGMASGGGLTSKAGEDLALGGGERGFQGAGSKDPESQNQKSVQFGKWAGGADLLK